MGLARERDRLSPISYQWPSVVGLEYELGANREIGVPRKNQNSVGIQPALPIACGYAALINHCHPRLVSNWIAGVDYVLEVHHVGLAVAVHIGVHAGVGLVVILGNRRRAMCEFPHPPCSHELTERGMQVYHAGGERRFAHGTVGATALRSEETGEK